MNDVPKSLGVQSRAAVNRSVRHEKLDSLPLPQSLKDECFENVAVDRSDEPARRSLEPCDKGCCTFPSDLEASKIRHSGQMRDWSERSKSACGAHLIYDATLSGLPSSADWLELPDRSRLLEHYRADPKRERRLALLNTLRFDPKTGLGDAHLWIRRFLHYEKVHGFYHVSVAAGAVRSFLDAVANLDVVVLPYGCVTDGGASPSDDERTCLRKHRRRLILVVKDDDYDYKLALPRVGMGFRTGSSYFGKAVTSVYVNSVGHLINAIAYVSRAKFDAAGSRERHYVVFNPVIWHAIWWMHLLVPGGHLDRFAEFRAGDEKKKFRAAARLGIENCVVRFHPLHQFVGDPVEDPLEHVTQERPFVFYFGRRVLNVEAARDVPRFVTESHDSDRLFVEWCASRQMNTLLNLNGNSWVDLSNEPHRGSLYETNGVWDGKKLYDFEDDYSDDDSEFNFYEGHVFDEGYSLEEHLGIDDGDSVRVA